jgi:hypothetical protein
MDQAQDNRAVNEFPLQPATEAAANGGTFSEETAICCSVVRQWIANESLCGMQVQGSTFRIQDVTRKTVAMDECRSHSHAVPQQVPVFGLFPQVTGPPANAPARDPIKVSRDDFPQLYLQAHAPMMAGVLHESHRSKPRSISLWPAPTTSVWFSCCDVPLWF